MVLDRLVAAVITQSEGRLSEHREALNELLGWGVEMVENENRICTSVNAQNFSLAN